MTPSMSLVVWNGHHCEISVERVNILLSGASPDTDDEGFNSAIIICSEKQKERTMGWRVRCSESLGLSDLQQYLSVGEEDGCRCARVGCCVCGRCFPRLRSLAWRATAFLQKPKTRKQKYTDMGSIVPLLATHFLTSEKYQAYYCSIATQLVRFT